MGIKDDILSGSVFGENKPVEETVKKKKKDVPKAKTMQEATSHLKSLNTKRKKSKAGAFVKGTHGSGAAKMREEYKAKKRARGSQKKKS